MFKVNMISCNRNHSLLSFLRYRLFILVPCFQALASWAHMRHYVCSTDMWSSNPTKTSLLEFSFCYQQQSFLAQVTNNYQVISTFFNSNYFNISLRKSSLTLINPMILEQPTALTKSFVLIISIKNPGCQAVLGTFSPSSLSMLTIVDLLYLDTILCMWTLPRSKYRTIFYYSWSLYNFAIELNLQCSASLSFTPTV